MVRDRPGRDDPGPSLPEPWQPAAPAGGGCGVAAAVDVGRLASLAELDRGDGFLDGLIDDFVADLDAVRQQLETAAAHGDVRAFRSQAHALRSSAAHVGALALFDLCLSWRELDDHALQLRAGAELAALRAEIGRTTTAMLAFRAERRQPTRAPRGER
jgi:two-component system sensor histidine kinase RpfC